MAWTFIDMMPADNAESAATSAARVHDSRVAAFHDPAHMLGRAMARRLGWKGHVAWDTYFIYRPGTVWNGAEMPTPDYWYHQLKDRVALMTAITEAASRWKSPALRLPRS
jgi:hypothetical protein